MEKREIGNSGIFVSAMALGTWAIGGGSWWGENDDKTSIRTIQKGVEEGIQWIDTAPVYGFGHSEEVVGRALKGLSRDKVILSTKCGLQWYEKKGSLHMIRDGHEVYRDLTKEGLRRDLEKSLRRLGTEYIDVYYTHWQCTPPAMVPIEETMDALMTFKKEGKIRAIGASNVTTDIVREYKKYGQLDAIQEKYSLLDRKIEQQLLPLCRELGITMQAYSPLEQGLLTGKIGMDYVVKPGEVRENRKWWMPENRRLALEMLESFQTICDRHQCPLSHVIIAWTMAQSERINVLCGARKLYQVEENVKGARLKLEKEEIQWITEAANRAIEKSKE